MKRVTGVGGLFFKSTNPERTKEWYNKHLGIPVDKYGGVFIWRDRHDPEKKGYTAWSPFPENTEYFGPGNQTFMFNYRVKNLVELIETLRNEGVEVVGKIEEYEYGKFGWIMDPDGNKIELWEPDDEFFGRFWDDSGEEIRYVDPQ